MVLRVKQTTFHSNRTDENGNISPTSMHAPDEYPDWFHKWTRFFSKRSLAGTIFGGGTRNTHQLLTVARSHRKLSGMSSGIHNPDVK
jgi:hypothetical protein